MPYFARHLTPQNDHSKDNPRSVATTGITRCAFRTDPILGKVFAYWQHARAHRTMPSRKDIRPKDLQLQLENIQLIDVLAGNRFQYRLVGTRLTSAFGNNYTGAFLDERFSGDRHFLAEQIYREVCDQKMPMFSCDMFHAIAGACFVANRLYLPLSEDGHSVTQVLGVVTFEVPPGMQNLPGLWGSGTLDIAANYKERIVLDHQAYSA